MFMAMNAAPGDENAVAVSGEIGMVVATPGTRNRHGVQRVSRGGGHIFTIWSRDGTLPGLPCKICRQKTMPQMQGRPRSYRGYRIGCRNFSAASGFCLCGRGSTHHAGSSRTFLLPAHHRKIPPDARLCCPVEQAIRPGHAIPKSIESAKPSCASSAFQMNVDAVVISSYPLLDITKDCIYMKSHVVWQSSVIITTMMQ